MLHLSDIADFHIEDCLAGWFRPFAFKVRMVNAMVVRQGCKVQRSNLQLGGDGQMVLRPTVETMQGVGTQGEHSGGSYSVIESGISVPGYVGESERYNENYKTLKIKARFKRNQNESARRTISGC